VKLIEQDKQPDERLLIPESHTTSLAIEVSVALSVCGDHRGRGRHRWRRPWLPQSIRTELCFPIPTAWMVQSQLSGPRSDSPKWSRYFDGIRRRYIAPTSPVQCAEASRTGALARRTKTRREHGRWKLDWSVYPDEYEGILLNVRYDRGSRGNMQGTCGRSLTRDLGPTTERHFR
jgi:hypothetical protein